MVQIDKFKAFVVEEKGDGNFVRQVTEKSMDDLPKNETLVKVHYSSLNYKDALSASGNRGVTRSYPHTPGIDAAGEIMDGGSSGFKKGDKVIVTSYDLGMNTSGGFGQFIRVPSSWVVPLPKGLTLRESMVFGTAGFTAGLSIFRLKQNGVVTKNEEILVTGATGGVGSLAVSLLSKAGFLVVAASGKIDAAPFLKNLGAKRVISRDDVIDSAKKPLLKGKWAGVVDTVGGEILSSAISATLPNGVITCCGNVASPKLHTTVFPFIIRGVSLVGIDSQNCPMDIRLRIWDKLSSTWKPDHLNSLVTEISLKELDKKINMILKGQLKGRCIINLNN